MIRRWSLVAAVALLSWVLSQDAAAPQIVSGSSLSASATRGALDARVETYDALRDGVIEARRRLIALRDRVSAIELYGAATRVVEEVSALQEQVTPWANAGITSGQRTAAEAMNNGFDDFVLNLTNVRLFQGMMLDENVSVTTRIEALEAVAEIDDAPSVPPASPGVGTIAVPHQFVPSTVMRSTEMNANLAALDAALAVEASVLGGVVAQIDVMAERVDVLEVALAPQPTFTWRIGTVDSWRGLRVESHFIFRNPSTFEPVAIRVEGPEGYERSTTVTNPATASTGWTDDPLPGGTYVAYGTVGDRDFVIPIEFDPTSVLAVPTVDAVVVGSDRVDVTVGRVDRAEYYDAQLRSSDSVLPVLSRWLTSGAFESASVTFQFQDLDLVPEATYEVFVRAYAHPAPWDPQLAAGQVDRSYAETTLVP